MMDCSCLPTFLENGSTLLISDKPRTREMLMINPNITLERCWMLAIAVRSKAGTPDAKVNGKTTHHRTQGITNRGCIPTVWLPNNLYEREKSFYFEMLRS